jgi:hypothetical protein
MHKETSSRVSSIAAEVMRTGPLNPNGTSNAAPLFNKLLEHAKTLAGSCMSQDETPGQAKATHGIHPAPAEFTAAEIATDQILHFFHYAHLPEKLRATSAFLHPRIRSRSHNSPERRADGSPTQASRSERRGGACQSASTISRGETARGFQANPSSVSRSKQAGTTWTGTDPFPSEIDKPKTVK